MPSRSSKDFIRSVYRAAVGVAALASLPLRRHDAQTAVFYGGARAGDFGGTQVKVKLLQQRFPQHFPGYSLLYVLSNAIYVPQFALDRLHASGLPIVVNQNGVFFKAWYPDGWERENARMAGLHAASDHVFFQSEFCRRSAQRFLGTLGKGEILYNAVDVTQFTPRAEQPKAELFTFLMSGKFGAASGYRLMSCIAGLATARREGLNLRLLLAGGVDEAVAARVRSELERLQIADAVTFTGPYTRAQASAIYRQADAYVTTQHNDACPNSVLEALASGLPVLYSASGGTPELVGADAGVGLPVEQTYDYQPVPEPLAIAEGMAKVVKSRESMARAARERAVGRFALSDWFDRHEAVFRDLVGRRAGS